MEEKMPVLSTEDQAFWKENGYVVVHDAVPPENIKAAEQAVWEFLEMDPNDPESWYPDPPRRSIMVEIYQHQALWNNRQHPRLHQAFAEIWDTEKLRVSFDRASMSPPNRPPYFERNSAGLHWDMSIDLPIRFHVQGVLYLVDTEANQGAFTCVPGFHRKIENWIKSLPEGTDPRKQNLESLGPIPVPAKAGDLVIWHSALPHGAGVNTADRPRVAQYITMTPAGKYSEEARQRRVNAWKNRMAGFSGERPEKEHETGKTAELTLLGCKLLGMDDWED
jgi:hypothetical protein